MTRINSVQVEVLASRHLVAEYKEMTQFLHLIKRRVANKTGFLDIPKEYTLNTGHCKFFYNKGTYITNRFTQLYQELLRRDIKVDARGYQERLERIKTTYDLNKYLCKDYSPTKRDMIINLDRMIQRITEKPTIYNEGELNVYVNLKKSLS